MNSSRRILGYTLSAFRGSKGGWVVWIEAPDKRHIFVNAPLFQEAQDQAEAFILEETSQRKEEVSHA